MATVACAAIAGMATVAIVTVGFQYWHMNGMTVSVRHGVNVIPPIPPLNAKGGTRGIGHSQGGIPLQHGQGRDGTVVAQPNTFALRIKTIQIQ